jgi:hypothetical protein
MNHLARFHLENCLPYFPQNDQDLPRYPCPFPRAKSCKKNHFNQRGLNRHLYSTHKIDIIADFQFQKAANCKDCDQNGIGTLFHNTYQWKQHYDRVHQTQRQKMYQCFLCQALVRTSDGLEMHINNVHYKEKIFETSFRCPEYERRGDQDQPEIFERRASGAYTPSTPAPSISLLSLPQAPEVAVLLD